jgi:hypothetical protein
MLTTHRPAQRARPVQLNSDLAGYTLTNGLVAFVCGAAIGQLWGDPIWHPNRLALFCGGQSHVRRDSSIWQGCRSLGAAFD